MKELREFQNGILVFFQWTSLANTSVHSGSLGPPSSHPPPLILPAETQTNMKIKPVCVCVVLVAVMDKYSRQTGTIQIGKFHDLVKLFMH